MEKYYLLLLVLVLGRQSTAQTIYVSSSTNELYRLQLNDCSHEYISKIDALTFDISFHPNGELYGLSPSGLLFKIDTLTGDISPIHDFSGLQTFNALTTDRNGLFYAIGSEGVLWSYNLNTSQVKHHGNIGYPSAGDLTFVEGKLYCAAESARIIRINILNPSNSSVVIRGQVDGDIYGIVSYARECQAPNAFALTNENTSIYQIDLATKELKFLCQLDLSIGGGASTYEFLNSGPFAIESIETIAPDCNESNGSLIVKTLGGSAATQYAINDGAFQSSRRFDNLSAGAYTVRIKDLNDCIQTKDFFLEEENTLVLDRLTVSPVMCLERTGSLSFSVSGGTAPIEVRLNEQDFQETDRFEGLGLGAYTLQFRDALGCQLETSGWLKREACPIYLPNAFSPNGDGVNDQLTIHPHPDFQGQFMGFKVFDRWGALVYEKANFEKTDFSWDGQYRGKALATGTYAYFLEYLDESGTRIILKSGLTIVR